MSALSLKPLPTGSITARSPPLLDLSKKAVNTAAANAVNLRSCDITDPMLATPGWRGTEALTPVGCHASAYTKHGPASLWAGGPAVAVQAAQSAENATRQVNAPLRWVFP